MGLGRIASALTKLRISQCEAMGVLKHLRWSGDGRLQLREPPEVRSFVKAKGAARETVAGAVRYLAAVREQRGQAPQRILSALSYAIAETLADQTPRGQQRQGQLKRQLLLHHTDIMCLQGLDPEGDGAGLTSTLSEENYGYAWSRSSDGSESNSIFWDRSRLKMESRLELEAAVAIDLRSFEDSSVVFRVVCMRPAVPTMSTCTGLSKLFVGRQGPLVVCADLSLLGGAECAVIVEELEGLSSVSQQVLGEEMLAPFSAPSPDGNGTGPASAAASGLNRLRCPDALLYQGLVPILALSGHTERYMATLPPEDVVQQFPAFRIPIVAAFNWQATQTQVSEDTAFPACQ